MESYFFPFVVRAFDEHECRGHVHILEAVHAGLNEIIAFLEDA